MVVCCCWRQSSLSVKHLVLVPRCMSPATPIINPIHRRLAPAPSRRLLAANASAGISELRRSCPRALPAPLTLAAVAKLAATGRPVGTAADAATGRPVGTAADAAAVAAGLATAAGWRGLCSQLGFSHPPPPLALARATNLATRRRGSGWLPTCPSHPAPAAAPLPATVLSLAVPTGDGLQLLAAEC